MSDGQGDVARIIAPPPLLFFAYLGAAWGADTLYSWNVEWAPVLPRIVAGFLLSAFAASLGAWAIWVMAKAKTPVEPWHPTERIVKRGPFGLTRNPLYLVLTTMLLVMALVVNWGWFYLSVPFLFATLHFGVVMREERYLEGKFGDEYSSPKKRVRRWF